MYASRFSSNLSVTILSKRSDCPSSLSSWSAYILGTKRNLLNMFFVFASASSMVWQIVTSSSRDRSCTCPIWWRYMRIGSSIISDARAFGSDDFWFFASSHFLTSSSRRTCTPSASRILRYRSDWIASTMLEGSIWFSSS